MSKHTPGPWTFDNGIEFICTDTSPYGEWAVAKVNIVRAEAKANARLIAAAPELLDALKLMRDAFLDTEGSHGTLEQTATDAAEAAIFKATGEQ
jgi:hypothetical protein